MKRAYSEKAASGRRVAAAERGHVEGLETEDTALTTAVLGDDTESREGAAFLSTTVVGLG